MTKPPDDILDDHDWLERRVRSLELASSMEAALPSSTAESRWRPSYQDLYAIAGHVSMMGCWDDFRHLSTGVEAFTGGHPGRAAEYCWAALDNRGFGGEEEAKDWTDFLYQLGAIPFWNRRDPSVIEVTPTGFVTKYTHSGAPTTTSDPTSRNMFWGGVPIARWSIAQPPFVRTDDDTAPVEAAGGYPLWDGSMVGDEVWLELVDSDDLPIRPVLGQDNFWTITFGARTGDTGSCGPVGPVYNESYFGEPWPLLAGPSPCLGQPVQSPSQDVTLGGNILVARLVLSIRKLYLFIPPKLPHPGTSTSTDEVPGSPGNEFSHWELPDDGTIFQHGPGYDWLVEGIDTILDAHPWVKGFYDAYLPIAYAKKHQIDHYTWQQLDVSMFYKGRVEAKLYKDRAILRGTIQAWSERINGSLFYWPRDWPEPQHPPNGAALFTRTNTGATIPFQYSGSIFADHSRVFTLSAGSEWENENGTLGPLTLNFDGLVLPLNMYDSQVFPQGWH